MSENKITLDNMVLRVYEKSTQKFTILSINHKTTLTDLAFKIGDFFDLDMFGHTFKFCTNIRNQSKGESYYEHFDEDEQQHTDIISCESVLNNIGKKLLFVQDLGDDNKLIITRKK